VTAACLAAACGGAGASVGVRSGACRVGGGRTVCERRCGWRMRASEGAVGCMRVAPAAADEQRGCVRACVHSRACTRAQVSDGACAMLMLHTQAE